MIFNLVHLPVTQHEMVSSKELRCKISEVPMQQKGRRGLTARCQQGAGVMNGTMNTLSNATVHFDGNFLGDIRESCNQLVSG